MSILSDAFDSVVDFFSGSSSSGSSGELAPGNGSEPPPSSTPAPSTGGSYGFGDLGRDILTVAGPLITTAITRPKPLPLPERPKFPEIPDSIKKDPRVQQLLSGYGLGKSGQPDNFPSIQQQALPRQSDFQVAFPAMFKAGTDILSREVDKSNREDQAVINQAAADKKQSDANDALAWQQAKIDAAKGGDMSTSPTTPNQVVEAAASSEPTTLDDKVKYDQIKVKGDAIKSTSKYDPLIEDAAKRNGVDADLLRAIIHTESGGNPNIIGDNGAATGLGQLHLGAAKDAGGRAYTQEELKDPLTNINLTAAYLKKLNTQFGGNAGDPDYSKAITAYNRGARAVKELGAYNSTLGRRYRSTVLSTLMDIRAKTGRQNAQ